MRLINTSTLRLEIFDGEVPKYAILSHRWEKDEVTFDDLTSGRDVSRRLGYAKLKASAEEAKKLDNDYIWNDTCCIDKSSSAELSEAINSMFQWYQDASVCISYLSDVDLQPLYPTWPSATINNEALWKQFHGSQWFTRGWTLQELIAPQKTLFFQRDWVTLGTKENLKARIEAATGIPQKVLSHDIALDAIPAGTRLSWASRRLTTRAEDIAYCLLGLLDVNMPLLYGEGKKKAFLRLQEEFLKHSDDESIYAWTSKDAPEHPLGYWGLLATSPAHFADAPAFMPPRHTPPREGHPAMMTNRGLRLELSLIPYPDDKSGTIFLGLLACQSSEGAFAIVLQRLSNIDAQYARIAADVLLRVNANTFVINYGTHRQNYLLAIGKGAGPYEEYHEVGNGPGSARWGGEPTFYRMTEEPRGEYFFVRQPPRPSGTRVAGLYMDGQTDLVLNNGSHMARCGITLNTTWGIPSERIWDDGAKISVDFDDVDFGPQQVFKIRTHRQSLLRGRALVQRKHLSISLEIISPLSSSPDPGTSISSMASPQLHTFDKYLALGIQPVPPNPFGTLPGFHKPWYGIWDTPDDMDVKVPEEEMKRGLGLCDGYYLTVDFKPLTFFSKVYFKLELGLRYHEAPPFVDLDDVFEPR